jgi:predicted RNA-binding protein associated with RNAse of E/G family
MSLMTEITIRKLDHAGRETIRYQGTLLERGETWVKLEAYYGLPDRDEGYVIFGKGDRFVEYFYRDRWYNIFEMHDVADDHLKGWYCNLTRPALIEADIVVSEDLALDVWVDPQGEILLLDKAEFDALPLSDVERAEAWRRVEELRRRVEGRKPPFDKIANSA